MGLSLALLSAAACRTPPPPPVEPTEPAEAAGELREALLESGRVDPAMLELRLPPSTRRRLASTALERQERLWRALAEEAKAAHALALEELEGHDLSAKIDWLALARDRNAGLHEQLRARYLVLPEDGSAARAVRALDPRDVSEETRWFWESVLLLPPGADIAPGAGELALEALARIGNPASTPVLLQFVEVVQGLPSQHAGLVEAHFRLAARTLLRMPGEPSASGMRRLVAGAHAFSVQLGDAVERRVLEQVQQLRLDQRRAWRELAARRSGEALFDGLRRAVDRGGPDAE